MVNKRPFHLVESSEFVDMCNALNGRFSVPNRKKVRSTANKMYTATKKAVTDVMRGLWRFYPSYTCDLWTAANAS